MPDPSRFLITEYYHAWQDTTLYMVVKTDTPCHLKLRWTVKPMRMHKLSTDFRGSDYMWDPYYCFVEWQEIDQQEPGDTLQHIFYVPDWPIGERRWYMFVGTINSTPSKSVSPIFTIQNPDQEEAMPLEHTKLIEKEPEGIIDHADKSVTAAKLEDNLDGVPRGLNAERVQGVRLRFITLVAKDSLIAGATWFPWQTALTDPTHYFLTIGFYAHPAQPTYTRLHVSDVTTMASTRGFFVYNEGPGTAYGIRVKIWALDVP